MKLLKYVIITFVATGIEILTDIPFIMTMTGFASIIIYFIWESLVTSIILAHDDLLMCGTVLIISGSILQFIWHEIKERKGKK